MDPSPYLGDDSLCCPSLGVLQLLFHRVEAFSRLTDLLVFMGKATNTRALKDIVLRFPGINHRAKQAHVFARFTLKCCSSGPVPELFSGWLDFSLASVILTSVIFVILV